MRKQITVNGVDWPAEKIEEMLSQSAQTDPARTHYSGIVGAAIALYLLGLAVFAMTLIIRQEMRFFADIATSWAGIVLIVAGVVLVRNLCIGQYVGYMVLESERVEYRFVSTPREPDVPMDDLYAWLTDIKVTKRTGQKRMRGMQFPSGRQGSDAYHRELSLVLQNAGLMRDGRLLNTPDAIAALLGLPPLPGEPDL